MPVSKQCEVCGKQFMAANARADTAKACSRACSGMLMASAYSAKRVKVECLKCGKPMEIPPSHAARGNGLYCSKDCHRLSQVGKRFTDKAELGNETMSSQGYVYERVGDHPFASRGRVFQHRLVIERMLAKSAPTHPFVVTVDGQPYLRPDIDVHHRNEVKTDNRPENLVACTKAAHKDMHAGKTPMAGEVWPTSGDEVETAPRLLLRHCQHCATPFTAKRSVVERGAGKFCSRKCLFDFTNPDGLPLMVPRSCQACGKEFIARRAKVLEGAAKFCSRDCSAKRLKTNQEIT